MGNLGEFEINLSLEELEKRTHKDYLAPKIMLKVDAEEFKNLEDSDKKSLIHLVKAANYLDDVYVKQDNFYNIPFRNYLEKNLGDDKKFELALKLFNAQRGIIAIDTESNHVILMKGQTPLLGKAFYPADLDKEEFHNILINMLKNGEKDEVSKILNQRSIVERDGKKLRAFDYCEKFAEEFHKAADELELAADFSTNKEFGEFLRLQAKALRENDAMSDAYADKKWATLQDTPLEFTITRENYEDELTGTVVENEVLNKMLEENDITPFSKDSIGIRVGIVNKIGTEMLLKIKKYLPLLAQNMPYNDEYEQNISPDEDSKQTMVDVDIVTLRGDQAGFRGGMTLAENLPNDDKLSLTIGGGRRNVYHRQVRVSSEPEKIQERLDAI